MTPKDQRQRIRGVFSQAKTSAIGTGTTARKTEAVTYYHARERDDGVLEVRALVDGLPVGEATQYGLDDFLERFLPEPQMTQVLGRAEDQRQGEVTRAVARGDKFYKQGKTFSAEFEYGKALALDEESVRANFGIGLCYVARGEKAKAAEVLQRLVGLEAAFQDEHKHLFNEFGISLRKAGMDEEALAFYARAAELSPNDENLHYNMARASYNLGDIQMARLRLAYCLTLNSAHEEARQFLDFLKRKHPEGG